MKKYLVENYILNLPRTSQLRNGVKSSFNIPSNAVEGNYSSSISQKLHRRSISNLSYLTGEKLCNKIHSNSFLHLRQSSRNKELNESPCTESHSHKYIHKLIQFLEKSSPKQLEGHTQMSKTCQITEKHKDSAFLSKIRKSQLLSSCKKKRDSIYRYSKELGRNDIYKSILKEGNKKENKDSNKGNFKNVGTIGCSEDIGNMMWTKEDEELFLTYRNIGTNQLPKVFIIINN